MYFLITSNKLSSNLSVFISSSCSVHFIEFAFSDVRVNILFQFLSMELKCNFKIGNWTHNPKLYTCTVTATNITEPNTDIISVLGQHAPGMSNKDVKAVDFRDSTVNYFPRRLDVIFPNLIALQIRNCDLKKISRRDLNGFEKLVDVCFPRNSLTSVPNDLFVGFHKLKMISLNDNKLERLSSQLLQPVLGNGLIHIELQNNKVIDAVYNPGVKGSVENVRELIELIDTKCGPPPNKAQAAGFKDLWTTGRHSDFVIVTDTKKFNVHKVVLATRSEFFSQMFENNSGANEMKIQDLSAKTVEIFLQFLYTGEIPD